MKQIAFIAVIAALSGCAVSMTPNQFMEKFPTTTMTDFYEYTEAQQALSDGTCELLVANRRYAAPQGMTVNEDLQNGANGVDEWVLLDEGNAFALDNFEWVSVGDSGGTQLIIYFDTMRCVEA